MAMNKRLGMFDCLTFDRTSDSPRIRGEVLDVNRLLSLRDALRANEPAPFDAACWMADAIDDTIKSGGSLDKRLGLKRRGKPSIRRTAEISKRDALIRSLVCRFPDRHANKRAEAVLAMLAGRIPPPDDSTAIALKLLLSFTNLPHSLRQLSRILSTGN